MDASQKDKIKAIFSEVIDWPTHRYFEEHKTIKATGKQRILPCAAAQQRIYYIILHENLDALNLRESGHLLRGIWYFPQSPDDLGYHEKKDLYDTVQAINQRTTPALRDSLTLMVGLMMGAPNGLKEVYEVVQASGKFEEIPSGWRDGNNYVRLLHKLQDAGLFQLSYSEVQDIAKQLAQEKGYSVEQYQQTVEEVLPCSGRPRSATTPLPSTTTLETTSAEPEQAAASDNTPATETKIGFVKPVVALLTAGIALFAGDSKKPEGIDDPEKQKGNWFQRNGKNVLRVLAGVVAIDMAQGMIRKQEPWTVKVVQSLTSGFRGKS